VNGPVVIGVRPFLPVKGIDLILGNDLADSLSSLITGSLAKVHQTLNNIMRVYCF